MSKGLVKVARVGLNIERRYSLVRPGYVTPMRSVPSHIATPGIATFFDLCMQL
jgi:hypothetical protein